MRGWRSLQVASFNVFSIIIITMTTIITTTTIIITHITLYPVNIHELEALYIINIKIHLIIKKTQVQ